MTSDRMEEYARQILIFSILGVDIEKQEEGDVFTDKAPKLYISVPKEYHISKKYIDILIDQFSKVCDCSFVTFGMSPDDVAKAYKEFLLREMKKDLVITNPGDSFKLYCKHRNESMDDGAIDARCGDMLKLVNINSDYTEV